MVKIMFDDNCKEKEFERKVKDFQSKKLEQSN